MTQHDTPEAVEARAEMLAIAAYVSPPRDASDYMRPLNCGTMLDTAAMLLRLHQRAVDAEQERERMLRAMNEMTQYAKKREASLATARGDALREAVPVAAALNASISLLERGGKKAAASDKMFAQMLLDYSAALDAFRALIPDTQEPRHD